MRDANASQTHYQVLGVSATASLRKIRTAYKEHARALHPDRNMHRQAWATAQFQALSEAFATLRDPAKRRAYDAALGSNAGAGPAPDTSGEKRVALARAERLVFDGLLGEAYRDLSAHLSTIS